MSLACGSQKMKNTPEQILAVLAACQAEPQFPSQVEVVGLDSFNDTDQQQKQAIFDDLHSRGLLQLVHASGPRTPLGWIITPKGAAERDLLRRLLGAAAK